MGKSADEELLKVYSEYLMKSGYSVVKIPERANQSPDLYVTKGRAEYINEFKAPELRLDSKTNLYNFKTTNSKIIRFINKAVNQLNSEDANHDKPWIVTFASVHFQLHWKNFTDALQGGIVFDSTFSSDFMKTDIFKIALKKIYQPDLYIWLQVSNEDKNIYQVTFVLNSKSNFKKLVEQIVLELKAQSISPLDNIIELY